MACLFDLASRSPRIVGTRNLSKYKHARFGDKSIILYSTGVCVENEHGKEMGRNGNPDLVIRLASEVILV